MSQPTQKGGHGSSCLRRGVNAGRLPLETNRMLLFTHHQVSTIKQNMRIPLHSPTQDCRWEQHKLITGALNPEYNFMLLTVVTLWRTILTNAVY